jgi:hypothetical protein
MYRAESLLFTVHSWRFVAIPSASKGFSFSDGHCPKAPAAAAGPEQARLEAAAVRERQRPSRPCAHSTRTGAATDMISTTISGESPQRAPVPSALTWTAHQATACLGPRRGIGKVQRTTSRAMSILVGRFRLAGSSAPSRACQRQSAGAMAVPAASARTCLTTSSRRPTLTILQAVVTTSS